MPTTNLYTPFSDQLQEVSNKAKFGLLLSYYEKLNSKDRDKFNVLYGTLFKKELPNDKVVNEAGRFMWDTLREYEKNKLTIQNN